MKLAKDELQKLALSTLLFIGLLYCYFSMMLGPLNARERQTRKSIAELSPQIEEAKKQIKRTATIETQTPATLETLEQIKGMIPEGAPVAWFPPRMTEFFKRQGIEKCAARLSGEIPGTDIPGFRRLVWSIDLPKVEFVPLAIALAGLENEEPLLEITNLQVEANGTDPQFQHAVLTVHTIVKL